MVEPLEQVMDALDIETFLVCDNENQGRNLMLALLKKWGLSDTDVVFAQHMGPGVRVRGRAYIHRPADKYSWIVPESEQEQR